MFALPSWTAAPIGWIRGRDKNLVTFSLPLFFLSFLMRSGSRPFPVLSFADSARFLPPPPPPSPQTDTLKPHCTNCLKHHSLQPDRASREIGCTWDEEKQPDPDPPPRKRRDGGKEKIQQLEGKIGGSFMPVSVPSPLTEHSPTSAQLERMITQHAPEGPQLIPSALRLFLAV